MTRGRLQALIDALIKLRDAADDALALATVGAYPEWKEDVSYEMGERVVYEGTLYKCIQNHTSITAWNPSDAISLWAEVLIPDPDVIPDWVQPESTNPYMMGDKVRHNGKVWESAIDYNVYEPPTMWNEVVE